MNRRQFASIASAGFLGLSISRITARQSTPSATPTNSGRPSPIDLGHGISLIDYRVYPSTPNHKVIGEIRNESGQLVDAPVVSLTYPIPHSDETWFAYAPPIVPVILPGGSVPIFGVLPDTDEPEAALESATFDLCSLVEYGEYSRKQELLNLEIDGIEESIAKDRYSAKVSMSNANADPALETAVRGVFRDANGRVSGCTLMAETGTVFPNEPKEFWLVAGGDYEVKADPFVLIFDASYKVDIIPGTRGPLTPLRCTFGKT